MYPELLTRHDLNVFLPPISGLTVYIFGDPSFMSRDDKEVTIRPHDECNGSDVFSSDVCTCRPYLAFGIEEAIKGAQKGGSGVIIYFRKEGRALGVRKIKNGYKQKTKREGDDPIKREDKMNVWGLEIREWFHELE